MGALTVALLPGVAMYGWVSTDNGLETVAGVAGLLLATSSRRGWQAAPILAGVAVTTYPSGLAWAAVIGAVCAGRALRSGWRDVLLVAAIGLAAGFVVVFPRMWWVAGPQRLVAGGGTINGNMFGNLNNLIDQLAVSGRSYYFFGDQPALGSAALATAVLLCTIVAAWTRWRIIWPWLTVAAVTVVLWIPAGNVPGVRRAIALSVIAALVLAVTLDVVVRMEQPSLRRLSVGVTAAVVLVPLARTHITWQHDYYTGEQTLVADFPIASGPMPSTFTAFDQQLRAGQLTVDDMARDHDGIRTLAVVRMLADRAIGDTRELPTPNEIIEVTIPPELRPTAPK